MDANYYHYPGPWIGAKPGFMNGGGFPMRFADLDGTLIDVYQQNTNLTDESTTNYADVDRVAARQRGRAARVLRRLRREHAHGQRRAASGRGGDRRGGAGTQRAGDLVQAAARPGSTAATPPRSAASPGTRGTLTFVTTVGAGANGLQTMLPVQGPAGTLTAITRAGTPVAYTVQTIKGVQYAVFTAATATLPGHVRVGRRPHRSARATLAARALSVADAAAGQCRHGEGVLRLLHGAEKGSVSS